MPDYDILVLDPAHDNSEHAILSYRKGDVEAGWTELAGTSSHVADLATDIARLSGVTRFEVNIVGAGALIAALLVERGFEVIGKQRAT